MPLADQAEGKKVNTIYLVRHGENPSNISKEFSYKKVDHSLTPKGVLQAQQTAEYFRHRHVDEVYSSPLKRAVETAQIIAKAKGLPVTIMENFREVNVGALEGQPPTEENWRFYANILRDWYTGKPESAFPEGEDLFMVERRAREGIERITRGKEGKSIIVVGHGGIFIVAVLHLCSNATPAIVRGDYHNCSITEIEADYVEGVLRCKLKGWGLCSHLSGEAAELVSALPDSLNQPKQ